MVNILAFHFTSEKDGHYPQLADTLQLLRDNGFTTVSAKQLADFFHEQKPLPAKPVFIVVTAGYRKAFKRFDSLLRKKNMQATMFLITKKLEQSDHHFVSWHRVKKMAKGNRWDLGLHGHQSFDAVTVNKEGDWLGNSDRG